MVIIATTMDAPSHRPVYRARSFWRDDDRPKDYRGSLEVIDEGTGERRAVCDLAGRAVFSTLEILDHRGRTWTMRPNRRVMPSRWVVTDPDGRVAVQLDQKLLGKLTNPLYRVALSLRDGKGEELYRLVDPRTGIPDRVMGLGPHEWGILEGERPVARLVRLSRQRPAGGGLLGKLKRALTPSDRGIISAGSDHLLPAPVALGLLLIFEELTDPSAG